MKDLIKSSAVALFATAFSVSCVSQSKKLTSKDSGDVIEYVSPGEGFNTKTFFYVGKSEVVAFDAQFTEKYAKEAIDHLRKFTQKPISWLVITHPNPDKFNGAEVFKQQGAKVVASSATKENMPAVHSYKKYYFVEMAKMFTNDTYPSLPSVDESFDTTLSLRLEGGETIELTELNKPGVSLNQTIALLPKGKGLIVGDLIHYKAHAWLEGGIVNSKATPTMKSWIENIEFIGEEFNNKLLVYGGRGQIGTVNEVTKAQIEYLELADELVDRYVDDLKNANAKITDENAGAHYGLITKEFEQQFPDYDLSYMIQYGVYGLVQSKL